jgi:TP901 family phage tail tape measure protein
MASGGRIKGITVEIGGDTGPLSAALKGVNGTIRETGTQLKDINRLLKLDPTNVTLLGQKAGVAQKELLALQEKEKTLKAADKDLKQQLSEGKISTEQYQAYQRELIATQEKIKELKKESTTVGNVLGAFGERAKGAGEKISDAGQKMLPATATIGAVGGAAVKTASDFETSMSQTAGALDIPMSKMGSLRDLAMKMGADTQFSATEAGNAMTELAKGGLTEADIKGGALKATMDLAASSGMDLGDAANTVVQAMGGFGLTAKDSAQAVNALAGAAAASSTDVGPLADALSQCAAQAHTVGWSIQDTTAVLGAFADAGINGSDAGTSLKTMLQRLGAPTDKAAAVMKKYGINIWDSNGHMKDASGIAQELQTKLGGLSDKQKQAALNTIFGSDATRAATVLMGEGSKGLAKYTKATNDQTAASRLANSQMGPTQKAMEQLKGSLETAAISIGTMLLPMIQKMSGFIKDLADKFSALSPAQQQTILTILGIVAAIGPLLILIGKVTTGIGAIAVGASKLIGGIKLLGGGIAKLFSLVAANPIILIVAAIAAIVAIVIHLWQTNEGFRNAVISIWTAIVGFFQTVGTAIAGFFVGAWNVIKTVWSTVTGFFSGVWQGIVAVFSAVGSWFASVFGAAWNGIKSIWSAVVGFFSGIWNGIVRIYSVVVGWFRNVFSTAWNGVKNVWSAVTGFFSGVWNGITKVFSVVGGWFSSTFGAAWTGIKNIWSAATGWFTGIWNGIKGAFKPNMISDAFGRAWGAIKDTWGGAAGWFRGVWNGISSGFRGAANAIIKAINWLIRGLNRIHFNIPDWVPGVGGKGFGIHIGEIPLLAKGGVIDKATFAMLGEQGKEAVLPLEHNTGWIKDLARALTASMGGFSQSAAVHTAPTQKIVLESHINMDGRELALAASPYFIKQLGFDNG